MNADQYIDHWLKNRVWTHLLWPKHQRRFARIASFLKGDSVLDVGCAFGHSVHQIRLKYEERGFKGIEYSGIDFSDRAIVQAKLSFPAQRFGYQFLYYPDVASLRAFKTFSVDSIVCSEVIEHVENDFELVAELVRIARERVVLTTPDQRVSDPGHLRLYTEAMIRELFDRVKRERPTVNFDYSIIRESPFFYIVVEIFGIADLNPQRELEKAPTDSATLEQSVSDEGSSQPAMTLAENEEKELIDEKEKKNKKRRKKKNDDNDEARPQDGDRSEA